MFDPKTIHPFKEDEIHQMACEVDHDLKNKDNGDKIVRWTNYAMACMLATIGELRKNNMKKNMVKELRIPCHGMKLGDAIISQDELKTRYIVTDVASIRSSRFMVVTLTSERNGFKLVIDAALSPDALYDVVRYEQE